MTTTHVTLPPATPATHVRPVPAAKEATAVRLSLAPARDHPGPVDGAWWPRSTDAAAELPALIAAVDQRLGEMTLRVGLHVDAWDNIPHRIPAPGRAVRVGWFRSMDIRLVTLSIRGKQDITLRLIPPEATETSAKAAFASATGDVNEQVSSGAPTAGRNILREPPAQSPLQQETDEGQNSWENEGGYGDARRDAPAGEA